MSQHEYAPCPFCHTPEPQLQVEFRDHYDIANARKDVLELRLVQCANCLASALEPAWLQLQVGPTPTPHEVQSGHTRQRHAEALIRQLPEDHDGRNTWLLNYGQSVEGQAFRSANGQPWLPQYEAAGPSQEVPHE